MSEIKNDISKLDSFSEVLEMEWEWRLEFEMEAASE